MCVCVCVCENGKLCLLSNPLILSPTLSLLSSTIAYIFNTLLPSPLKVLFWTGVYNLLDLYTVDACILRDSCYLLGGILILVFSRTFYAMAYVYPPDEEQILPIPTHDSPWYFHLFTAIRALVGIVGQNMIWLGAWNLLENYYPSTVWREVSYACIGMLLFLLTNSFVPNSFVNEDDEDEGEGDEEGDGTDEGKDDMEKERHLWYEPEQHIPKSTLGTIQADGDGIMDSEGEETPTGDGQRRGKISKNVARVARGYGTEGYNEKNNGTMEPLLQHSLANIGGHSGITTAGETRGGARAEGWNSLGAFSTSRALNYTNDNESNHDEDYAYSTNKIGKPLKLNVVHPPMVAEVSFVFYMRTLLALSGQVIHSCGVWTLLDTFGLPFNLWRDLGCCLGGLGLLIVSGTLMQNAAITPIITTLWQPEDWLPKDNSDDFAFLHFDGNDESFGRHGRKKRENKLAGTRGDIGGKAEKVQGGSRERGIAGGLGGPGLNGERDDSLIAYEPDTSSDTRSMRSVRSGRSFVSQSSAQVSLRRGGRQRRDSDTSSILSVMSNSGRLWSSRRARYNPAEESPRAAAYPGESTGSLRHRWRGGAAGGRGLGEGGRGSGRATPRDPDTFSSKETEALFTSSQPVRNTYPQSNTGSLATGAFLRRHAMASDVLSAGIPTSIHPLSDVQTVPDV